MTTRRKTEGSRLLRPAEIAKVFQALAAKIVPKPELEFSTTLDLLVAVVLSAQTTDKAVNLVTRKLWQVCRTPEDYLRLGQEGLEEYVHSIGLYRNKARSILGICQALLAEHGGQVPGDFESLVKLPGVGRKTANVVLNVGFGQPTLAVDTHIFRVANRLGLVKEPTPEAVEKALLPKIPEEYRLNAHHYLLLHGRYCCQARKPQCGACVVAAWCRQRAETPKTVTVAGSSRGGP